MLNFIGSTKFMVGKGAISKIPYEMQYFNSSRALIIVDSCGQKYLKAFFKKLNNDDITVDIAEVGDNFAISDVNFVIEKFYETGANAIIALGGASAIDISKAVSFTVSCNQNKFVGMTNQIKVVNNISLFIVPTVLGAKNCASKNLMLLDDFGVKEFMESDRVLANAIILDPAMTKHVKESEVIEKGTFAVMQCLTAVIEDISIFARAYAIAGVTLAREWGYENYTTEGRQKDRRFSAMIAGVYAGLASDENKDFILPILAMSVSDYAHISFYEAYNALALQYLDIYTNETRQDALGLNSFIGVDNALKYEKSTRSKTILKQIIDLFGDFRAKFNQKLFLSDHGVTNDDLIKIYDIAIKSKLISADEYSKRIIMEMLNRSL